MAKFCGEQADAAGAAPTPDADDCRTLWSVLHVLAAHQGRTSSAPYSLLPPSAGGMGMGSGKQQDAAAQPEPQLAAALLDGVSPASTADAQLLSAATPPSAAAAAEIQQLLMLGRRTDALRWASLHVCVRVLQKFRVWECGACLLLFRHPGHLLYLPSLTLRPSPLPPLSRVAVDAQVWSVALLLSRLLGEAAVAATAASMAERSVADGAPLQTLLLLLGGASAERPLAAAVQASQTPATEAPQASQPWQQPGVFNPAVAVTGGAAGGSDAWRRHLAVMAANRTPGDEAAMTMLGCQLLAAGQLLPAHICFALAGVVLQPWDLAAAAAGAPPGAAQEAAQPLTSGSIKPGAGPVLPLVLLGSDAVRHPRACAQLHHILATEVYSWSRTVGEPGLRCVGGCGGACVQYWLCHPLWQQQQHDHQQSCSVLRPRTSAPTPSLDPHSASTGNTALSGHYLAVLPYKVLHAATLAELGLLPQASAYCQSIQATLQVGGGGVQSVLSSSTVLGQPLHAGSWRPRPLLTPKLSTRAPHLRSLQALGSKVPPGLLVCRAVAADLQDRLQQYAAVSGARLGCADRCLLAMGRRQ